MEQYIPKSAVVAEIEKRRNFDKELKLYSRLDECNGILYFLNTLEVKEVDLEKELSTYLEVVKTTDEDIDFFDFAKHFFELGIQVSNKAQKGE